MADEELGARLRLRDRREFSEDANRAARDVREIGDEADKADRKGRNLAGGMGMASRGIGGLSSAAGYGIAAVAGLGAGVGLLAAKTVGLATDAGETAAKFNTVFAGMETQVGGFIKQVNADYGIPTKDLQDAASTFGVFAKAAGIPKEELADFSTSLTQAGLDMASFYNQNPEDVFLALRSGLAGESEPLRQFGIFMSDASLNAFAAAEGIGKTTKEMSEQEKVALRQKFILANLGDANGDLARTSDSLANQMRGVRGRITEAGTAIGTAFIPYAEWGAQVLNDNLAPAVSWLTDNLPGMVNGTASAIGDAYQRVARAWEGGASYGETVGALTGMSAVVDPVNRVADALGDVWVITRDGIIPAFRTVQDAVPGLTSPLDALDSTLDFLADNASTLHPLLVGMVAVFTAWKFAVFTHNAVMAVSGTLMAARVGITMLLTGATGLAAGAEMTKNQAMLASIGLHLRLGAMMAWHAARAVASAVLTGLTVVGTWIFMAGAALVNGAIIAGQWVLMGLRALANVAIMAAQGAIVVGSWILMGATAMASGLMMAAAWLIGLGPIGLAIAALVAIGAIFVALWMKSETFRDVVTGAISAVWGGIKTAFDWVKNNWPLLLAILTGPFGLAVLVITRNFDTIKDGIKGAINYLIDRWNGLSFTVPSLEVFGQKIGGFTLSTPNIPRLHSGGTTTSAGLVNMRPDEELIVLPPAASVVPMDDDLRELASDLTSGRGDQPPMVLQLVVDRKVLAEAVYDHTGDKVART